MPSDPVDLLARLPALQDGVEIARPVSGTECYHASVGTSRHSLEPARGIFFTLSGQHDGSLAAEDWQRAIAQVAAVNPALRLRWHGRLGWSRWRSDGPLPRLRLLDHCDWDMHSSRGAGFITETPLDLRHGPVVEFIVVRRGEGRATVILRSLHAVMDGMGALHCLHELFRALRGEPLLGSNATFSDVDLMRAMAVPKAAPMHEPTCTLTGGPAGDAPEDDWWRIPLGPMRTQLLARVAIAMADFAHQHSTQPVLIAVPVDLRRHVPGIRAVTNFSSMLLVRLLPGDGIDIFQQRLRAMLDARREAAFGTGFEVLRWLPLRWLDHLIGRNEKNFRTRKPMETALISYLGRVDLSSFQAPGFVADDMLVLPLPGSAFAVLVCVNGEVTLTLNLPRVLSSGGRVEALITHLQERLRA